MKKDNPFTHDVHARDKSFYRTVLPAEAESTRGPHGVEAEMHNRIWKKKGKEGGGAKRDILSNESMKINMCYIY